MSEEEEAKEKLKDDMPWLVQLGLSHSWDWFKSLDSKERMNLLGDVVRYLLTLGYLDGYTEYFAGAASIFSGFTLIFLAIAHEPSGDIEKGIGAIIAGIFMIGHAKKQDKYLQSQRVIAELTAEGKGEEAQITLESLPAKPKLLSRPKVQR